MKRTSAKRGRTPSWTELISEIGHMEVMDLIDQYLEGRMGKIDLSEELPPDIKSSLLKLERWIQERLPN